MRPFIEARSISNFGFPLERRLLKSRERLPFGPVSKLTYGNGRTQTRAFDLAFGIDAISSSEASGWTADYGLDAAGDVTSILGTGSNNRFGYDSLRRLNKVDDVASQPRRSFGYDGTGNRTSETTAVAATTLTYPASSHRLSAAGAQSRTYDAMGNPLTVGPLQLRYDQRAKLDQVTLVGGELWLYQYNGHALRTSKWKPSEPLSLRFFVYNEAAQLIGEYDSAGALLSEVLWLDNLPIGVITMRSGTPVLSYIESDHLGTPRVVVDPTRNTAIWRWSQTDYPFV